MKQDLPETDGEAEVTIGSGLQYVFHTWRLGLVVTLKAAAMVGIAALMLGLPGMFLQNLVSIPIGSEEGRRFILPFLQGLYYVVLVPIAFYVGGSSVGICRRISSSDFPRTRQHSAR